MPDYDDLDDYLGEEEEEDNFEDDEKDSMERLFLNDFIKGCNTFVYIAMRIKGIEGDSGTFVSDMIKEIAGNRNHDDPDSFNKIIPQLYEKIIEFCSDAVRLSNEYDLRKTDKEFEKYKKKEEKNNKNKE